MELNLKVVEGKQRVERRGKEEQHEAKKFTQVVIKCCPTIIHRVKMMLRMFLFFTVTLVVFSSSADLLGSVHAIGEHQLYNERL